MDGDIRQRVRDLLREMSSRGLDAAKEFFWTELNYDRANQPLSTREWPERVRGLMAEAPTLFAQHDGGQFGTFDVLYARLGEEQAGRTFPLSVTAERDIIKQLLKNHPYALFLFSDPDEQHWHMVNVRYDRDESKRRIFRRIAIGPYERLRTAAERIARLDLATLSPDLFGLSPLAIQQRHDEAFDVEAVSDEFFQGYSEVFNTLRADLIAQMGDASWAHDFAHQFLNRIMFLYYVQRKRWLGEDPDFLANFWHAYDRSGSPSDTFVTGWLNVLFFEAFNNRFQAGRADRQYLPADIRNALQMAPFLNGGLFEPNKLDKEPTPLITDACFEQIFRFLEGYNFTISEDTPLDQEVAVDPEMIGRVYESLVNVSERVDERGEAGIFYTPRVEIDLMCRLALVDWLANHLGQERKPLLYEAVFAYDPEDKTGADEHLTQANLWPRLNDLLRNVTVLDPACGSGSFLVGMLYVLNDLLARADRQLGKEETPYERKKDIIANSLYGVDVMEWAVHVAELRLWLQLVIDTELEPAELKFRPLLPNLSFKIRPGDSLVQEVGGINLALRRGSALIPPHLKGQITRLQGEKLKFYNNQPDRLYRSEEQLRHAELLLFRDILDSRDKAIDDRLREIEVALRPQRDLMGNLGHPLPDAQRGRLGRERDALETEQQQVGRARQTLRGVEDVPFVWDVAFVEIFEGEKGGFDIVIGNPPYVRQERIRDPRQALEETTAADRRAYKQKLLRSAYTTWPRTFGYDWSKDQPRQRIGARCDLYVYFYLHGLSLLNDSGSFCFITSNSWLDVGYGKDLQEFLLTRGKVKLILDNQARRSFARADVNTVIVLLGAPQDGRGERPDSFSHTARFVMLTVPFEEVLDAVIWQEVEDATARKTKPEYRVHPMQQAELLESGMDPERKRYAGDKWGGKYLRAPDIYWTILEKGKGKLVRLGDIAEVRRGFTTGADDWFYLSSDQAEALGIEPRFLRPILTDPDLPRIALQAGDATRLCILASDDKPALAGTNLLRWIVAGETQEFGSRPALGRSIPALRPTCRSRRRWYELPNRMPAPILWIEVKKRRSFTLLNSPGLLADRSFYDVRPYQHNARLVCALLNCTLTALFCEVLGNAPGGRGAGVQMPVSEVRKVRLLSPEELSEVQREEMLSVFEALGTQTILPLEKEIALPDRRALDKVVFDVLKLTDTERDAFYEGVVERVKRRVSLAKSL